MCSLYPFFPILFATFLLLLLLILLVFEQTFYYISIQTTLVISLTALSSNFPLLFALLIFLQSHFSSINLNFLGLVLPLPLNLVLVLLALTWLLTPLTSFIDLILVVSLTLLPFMVLLSFPPFFFLFLSWPDNSPWQTETSFKVSSSNYGLIVNYCSHSLMIYFHYNNVAAVRYSLVNTGGDLDMLLKNCMMVKKS